MGDPPALPGRQSKFDISGSHLRKLPTVSRSKHTEGSFADGRTRKPKSHQVGVQISRGVHPEVQTKDAVRRVAEALGGGVPTFGGAEGEPDRRGAPDGRPRAHDDLDTAEAGSVRGDRVHQGEERDPSCAGVRGEEAELRGTALLGEGVLRIDGREGRESDPGVHQEARGRGSANGSDEPMEMRGHLQVAEAIGAALATP